MIVINLDGEVYQLPAEIVAYIQLLQAFVEHHNGTMGSEQLNLKVDYFTKKIAYEKLCRSNTEQNKHPVI
jgi:hypothetical protein